MGTATLEETVTLLAEPLLEADSHVSVQRVDDPEALLDTHAQEYADLIFRPQWRELVLVLSSKTTNPRSLQAFETSSYYEQALRQGLPMNVLSAAVSAVVLTADERVVCGIRAGNIGVGMISALPMGVLSARAEEGNPLYTTMRAELREELALTPGEYSPLQLIGSYTVRGRKGVHFVFYTETSLPSRELAERHREAFAHYAAHCPPDPVGGVLEADVKRSLAKAGFRNIDAREHSKLVFLPNDQKMFETMISREKVEFGEEGTKDLYPNSRGIFQVYHLFKTSR